jgi:hypothetical protein
MKFNYNGGYGNDIEIDDDIVKLMEQEGDFHEWIDQYSGYTCRINRVRQFGHWCGYVKIPDNHPFNHLNYEGIYHAIDVHGGITFQGTFEGLTKRDIDKSGNWIGFDCAHAGDYVPRLGRHFGDWEYRTKEFVMYEVTGLCKQLKDLEGC